MMYCRILWSLVIAAITWAATVKGFADNTDGRRLYAPPKLSRKRVMVGSSGGLWDAVSNKAQDFGVGTQSRNNAQAPPVRDDRFGMLDPPPAYNPHAEENIHDLPSKHSRYATGEAFDSPYSTSDIFDPAPPYVEVEALDTTPPQYTTGALDNNDNLEAQYSFTQNINNSLPMKRLATVQNVNSPRRTKRRASVQDSDGPRPAKRLAFTRDINDPTPLQHSASVTQDINKSRTRQPRASERDHNRPRSTKRRVSERDVNSPHTPKRRAFTRDVNKSRIPQRRVFKRGPNNPNLLQQHRSSTPDVTELRPPAYSGASALDVDTPPPAYSGAAALNVDTPPPEYSGASALDLDNVPRYSAASALDLDNPPPQYSDASTNPTSPRRPSAAADLSSQHSSSVTLDISGPPPDSSFPVHYRSGRPPQDRQNIDNSPTSQNSFDPLLQHDPPPRHSRLSEHNLPSLPAYRTVFPYVVDEVSLSKSRRNYVLKSNIITLLNAASVHFNKYIDVIRDDNQVMIVIGEIGAFVIQSRKWLGMFQQGFSMVPNANATFQRLFRMNINVVDLNLVKVPVTTARDAGKLSYFPKKDSTNAFEMVATSDYNDDNRNVCPLYKIYISKNIAKPNAMHLLHPRVDRQLYYTSSSTVPDIFLCIRQHILRKLADKTSLLLRQGQTELLSHGIMNHEIVPAHANRFSDSQTIVTFFPPNANPVKDIQYRHVTPFVSVRGGPADARGGFIYSLPRVNPSVHDYNFLRVHAL